MTLKQKIRVSNILLVLVPIVVTSVVVIVCMKTSLGGYWHTLETMYKDENGIQSAQGLIYTYKKELWEWDWERPVFNRNETMTSLERKLMDMGYYIQIRNDGELIYSNISDEDMQAAQEVAGDALETAKTLTASRKNVSVIKYTFIHGEQVGTIVAVNNNHSDEHMKSYLQSYILTYIIAFSVLFFVMLLLLNALLSRWISKSVLIPLKKLSAGAKEIRDGNLDGVIDYEKKDEFGRVCRDFDEMREYLKESMKQRLEYENRRRELISGISHDLRTPLTSIRGYLDGLVDGIAATPKMQERYLEAMKIRTADLERLVDSLSEYNRLDNDSFQYQMKARELQEYLYRYLEENRGETDKCQVHIDFACMCESCPVLLDGEEFKRVLDNLFTNTVKYRTKDSSQVNITLAKDEEKGMAELVFSDDGPGVPEDMLERIFESFYRVDGARTHSGEGSGIGLAVVRAVVNGHGGTVWAENDNGLTIKIRLPLLGEEGEDEQERK